MIHSKIKSVKLYCGKSRKILQKRQAEPLIEYGKIIKELLKQKKRVTTKTIIREVQRKTGKKSIVGVLRLHLILLCSWSFTEDGKPLLFMRSRKTIRKTARYKITDYYYLNK